MRPVPAARSAPPSSEAVMAKAARENFPVASRLLPRDVRQHLLAIYGFARLVDDIGAPTCHRQACLNSTSRPSRSAGSSRRTARTRK